MTRHTVTCFPMSRTFTHYAKGKKGETVMVQETAIVVQHDIYRPKDQKKEFYWRGARIDKPT